MDDTSNSRRAKILQLVSEYVLDEFRENIFVGGESEIAASGKSIGVVEVQNIVESALDGWLTAGRFNEAFEKKLSAFLGVKYCLTVNSGSSANLVAFNTLTSPKLGDKAIRPGDEVITVAAGFPTTVNPIVQFGAVPVFVDIDLNTYNIDVALLDLALSERTKAVMLAHTLGNPCNLRVVSEFCKKNGLWFVEDCCDALGSRYEGRFVGTFGDIATLSFYPAHHITMGEGGAIFTNNGKLKKIAESFRDWGRDCYCPPGRDNTCNNRYGWTKQKLGGDLPDGYDHKYIYSHVGYNLKITDMQAACGVGQLEKLDSFIDARKSNFKYLIDALEPLQDKLLLPRATEFSDPSWFGFPLTLRTDDGKLRVTLLRFLSDRKIGTRLLFAGNLTRQPYFKNVHFRSVGSLENTDTVMRNTFWIGIHPSLTKEMLDYMAKSLHEFFS